MSIQSEINRLSAAKADIAAAISEQGVTVPAGSRIDQMAALVRNIPKYTTETWTLKLKDGSTVTKVVHIG